MLHNVPLVLDLLDCPIVEFLQGTVHSDDYIVGLSGLFLVQGSKAVGEDALVDIGAIGSSVLKHELGA